MALKELGIFRTLLHRILHNIVLKSCRPHLLQVLNEDNPDKRLEFCENFVQFCEESPGSVTFGTPCIRMVQHTKVIRCNTKYLNLKQKLNCKNYGIYVAQFKNCNMQYVGKTKNKLSVCWTAHR